MEKHTSTPQDEVKITDLFSQIGRAFRSLGRAIGNFFKSIYHLIILFLLFVRRNIIFIGGATLLGFIIGLVIDLNKNTESDTYYAGFRIKVTSGSGNLLYDRIENINNLITASDTLSLAKVLDIPAGKVTALRDISIEPHNKKAELIKDYELFRQTTDTIITNHVSFSDFGKRYADGDYKFHDVRILSQDPELIPTVKERILSMAADDYYKRKYERANQLLKFKQSVLTRNIQLIDTLIKQKYAIERIKAEHTNDISDFSISNNSRGENSYYEVEMIRTSEELLNKLKIAASELDRNQGFVRAVTPLSVPVLYTSLTGKTFFRYALYGFILSVLILSLIRFNSYLNSYERKLESGE